MHKTSVPDPHPDLPDPHVLGPPGSGSIRKRYESGSGSFCLPYCFVTTFGLLSLKIVVNVPSKSHKQKTFFEI
jgi:hypothetical protein